MPDYGYTIIYNAVFRDTRISAKAKGIYCQLLSLPDNWHYNKAGLLKLFKDEEVSIESGLKELKKYGYLEIKQTRNDNGTYTSLWDICKEPKPP